MRWVELRDLRRPHPFLIALHGSAVDGTLPAYTHRWLCAGPPRSLCFLAVYIDYKLPLRCCLAFHRPVFRLIAASVRHPSPSDAAPGAAPGSANHDAARMAETVGINQSLHYLKECVRAVALGHSRVPFRESNLTRLLRGALSDPSSMTSVIATISPSASDTEHSHNTLRHALIMDGPSAVGVPTPVAGGDRVRVWKQQLERVPVARRASHV